MTIGARIRKTREASKMNQEALAFAIGVCQGTICNIESDRSKVDFDTILRICKALNCDIKVFVCENNEDTMQQSKAKKERKEPPFNPVCLDMEQLLTPVYVLIEKQNTQNGIIQKLLEQNAKLIELLQVKI